MADYNKFDPRMDSLVVETRTLWSADVADLGAEDKAVIAKAIHAQPQLAATLQYERAHTGFTRIITVQAADIEKLYVAKMSGHG